MNLENTKEGDLIRITAGWDGERVVRVERTTKTQVIAGGIKFNRSGFVVGADSFNRAHATAPKDDVELAEWIRVSNRKNRIAMLTQLKREQLERLSDEALIAMADAYRSGGVV